MTLEEESIVNLTKENLSLKKQIATLKDEQSRAEMMLSRVGVPSGFEDGNSWDDYCFNERVNLLCRMYDDAKYKAS